MTSPDKVPAHALRFDLVDPVLLAAANGEGDKKAPTFEMVANSGKPILGHWYWGNLGIDLAGVKCPKRLAILVDHNPGQRIGYSTATELDEKRGLVVRGNLLPSSPLAQQVRQESLDGFPWQASVHLVPLKMRQLAEGETAEVNGYPITGPGTVFLKSTCREVSFTALGADESTTAAAFSEAAHSQDEDDMTKTASPATPAPDLEAARAEGSAAALQMERQRAAAILAAAIPDQHDLAQKLVNDGTPLADALAQINADLKVRLEASRKAPATAKVPSDAPLSGGNAGPDAKKEPTPLELAQQMPDGPDKWGKLYEHDPAIRAEFSSAKSFTAFKESPAARGAKD